MGKGVLQAFLLAAALVGCAAFFIGSPRHRAALHTRSPHAISRGMYIFHCDLILFLIMMVGAEHLSLFMRLLRLFD